MICGVAVVPLGPSSHCRKLSSHASMLCPGSKVQTNQPLLIHVVYGPAELLCASFPAMKQLAGGGQNMLQGCSSDFTAAKGLTSLSTCDHQHKKTTAA